MISVRAALQTVVQELPRLGSERVAIGAARGRVLAAGVVAGRDVPPFRNAAMDGYAVRAEDVANASSAAPVSLAVLETIAAGTVPERALVPGTASRIMTGALMPEGADAVVRVEDTNEKAGRVEIRRGVRTGDCVRLPGEDVRAGELVFEAGRVLRAADIGVLASIGQPQVEVVRRPRVAVVTTGDELVEVDETLVPGKIVNSNAYTLAAAVEEAGGEVVYLGVARDDRDAMAAMFERAFEADAVLSTGGVSAGQFDLVRETLRQIGYREFFWKVAQKPGKPMSFGMRGTVPVFGLPGNPVSALVCFYVYVWPALRKMMRLREIYLPVVYASMGEKVRKTGGLTEFIRCRLEVGAQGCRAFLTGSQSSGILRSMSLGDGLIVAPAQTEVLDEHAVVRILLLAAERCTAEMPV